MIYWKQQRFAIASLTELMRSLWCLNKNKESVETKHTVDVLLQVAETQDCNQANKFLSTRTPFTLILTNKQITDLRPLSSLTNLTDLYLYNNQITDLRPLSPLTNLTEFSLTNNQIADLKPLSRLTNLTELTLNNNPSLTNKTCPIKPASICKFAPSSR